MLPFIKVFSLIVRAFSRPLINYTKRYHNSNRSNIHQYLKAFFIRLGNFYNRQETRINKKFLKIEIADDVFIKPLSDDVALDKGVEFFYEIFFYSIVLSLPLYEMWIQQESNNKKAEDLKNKLEHLDNEVKLLHSKELEFDQKLENQILNLESLVQKNEKNTGEIIAEMNVLKYQVNKLVELQMKSFYKDQPAP